MKSRSALATAVALALAALATPVVAQPDQQDWESILADAEGQTVYWNAWGGDDRTNRYIDWVAGQMRTTYGVRVEHVKLDDTSSAVARVLGEKQAGNHDDGSIDLIWINGENFAAMRAQDLLFGPFADSLPHFALTHPDDNPEVVTDFTLPTEGYESPGARRKSPSFTTAPTSTRLPRASKLCWIGRSRTPVSSATRASPISPAVPS